MAVSRKSAVPRQKRKVATAKTSTRSAAPRGKLARSKPRVKAMGKTTKPTQSGTRYSSATTRRKRSR